MQTLVRTQIAQCQLDQGRGVVAVQAALGVALHRLVSLGLLSHLRRLHHYHKHSPLQFLQMALVILCRHFQILLQESLYIEAITGKPERWEDLCLNHILWMSTAILHGEVTMDHVEMVLTITIMAVDGIKNVEIMQMPEMFICSSKEVLGALLGLHRPVLAHLCHLNLLDLLQTPLRFLVILLSKECVLLVRMM